MTFDLFNPTNQHGWSFFIYNPTLEAKESLFSLTNTPLVRRAKPLVTCDRHWNPSWARVEFVSENEEAIITASSFLESSLK